MKNYWLTLIYLATAFTLVSCKKFLDEKPDKQLVVPKTLSEFQAILDNNGIMNRGTPGSGEASADNFYLPDAYYDAISTWERNLYTWKEESIDGGSPANDWSRSYLPVYHSNVVLEGIQKIERTVSNSGSWDNLRGSALFYRAKYFFDAALLYAKAYDQNTAATDLGIPLRLNSNFNETSVRASLAETYNKIISDLKESENLLPLNPTHVMRPSRPAVYFLLARIYLSMRDYDKAFFYADKCLQLKNALMDFNTPSGDYDPSATFPIKLFNREVIMHFRMDNTYFWWPLYSVDSVLRNSYASNDVRGRFYFQDNGDGTFNSYPSSYEPDYNVFTGFATDEMYLTRAECHARKGNVTEAMNDLNALLVKRYDATFVPVGAANPIDALNKILIERRKELVARGTRWMDLKRLNAEGADIPLTRIVHGQTYLLPPNSNKYALPIPTNIIELSGIPQNPR